MKRTEVLEAARKCVCGQREQDYGTPEDSFQRIADLWNAYMGQGPLFDPTTVAIMMALLKVARIRTGVGTEDSFVDLAGYAACAGEIATRTRERTKAMTCSPFSDCSECDRFSDCIRKGTIEDECE